MYCYVLVYSEQRLLLFRKNIVYYFFNRERVYRAPKAFRDNKYPGKLVLPGGKPENELVPEAGAYAEFLEETGISLHNHIYEEKIEINDIEMNHSYCLCLKYSEAKLDVIFNECLTNFAQKRNAIDLLINNPRKVILNENECIIRDDELSNAEIFNFSDIDDIDFMSPDCRTRDWFKHFINIIIGS